MSKRRFIIEVDGVYYMTSGPMLVYDKNDTKGDDNKKDGVDEVHAKFQEVKQSSATYSAVELTDSSFAATHSSES